MRGNVSVTELALEAAAKQAITDFIVRMLVKSDDVIKLVMAKNADYGDAWQRFDIFTPLVRLNDKLLRVQTLSGGKQALVAGEKIEDTIVDIVGYGLLELLKLHQEEEVVQVTPEETIIQNLPDTEEVCEPTPEEEAWLREQSEKQQSS